VLRDADCSVLQVELFHHSRDLPATISKLVSTLDRASGKVIKRNPRCVLPLDGEGPLTLFRVLTKGMSAEVQVALRPNGVSVGGSSSVVQPIPLEPFAQSKEMGRILIRRGGETIAAGEFKILSHHE
jgi:elongation factor 1 alpha-like protein